MRGSHFTRMAPLAVVILVAGLPVQAIQPRLHSAAAPGTWRLIGRTLANPTTDHAAFQLQRPYHIYRRIKLKVVDTPLDLVRLVVEYDHGPPETIDSPQRIAAGGASTPIELHDAGDRGLREVDFWYDTRESHDTAGTAAHATLYGLK